jgi:hypothetical protein
MWHAPCTYVIQGDSRFLVVGNQIDTLNLGLSFDHNLCCKYSNGSCKLILNIYISRNFQWYKEVFNPMNFGPSNWSLEIWESLGSVWAYSFTVSCTPGRVNVILELHSWPSPLHAPCFGHELKAKVVTIPFQVSKDMLWNPMYL